MYRRNRINMKRLKNFLKHRTTIHQVMRKTYKNKTWNNTNKSKYEFNNKSYYILGYNNRKNNKINHHYTRKDLKKQIIDSIKNPK